MTVGFLEQLGGQSLTLLTEAFERTSVAKAVVALESGGRGRLVEVNAALCALLGHPRQALVGRFVDLLFGAADRSAVAAVLDAMAAGTVRDAAREWHLVRRDGSRVWVSSRAVLAHDGTGAAYMVVEAVETTDRHALAASEAALRRSEEQFRTAFEGSPLGLIIVDEEGRFVRANPAAAALTGRPPADLVGLTYRDVTDPGDLPRANGTGSPDICYDTRLRHPDGRTVWTRLTLSSIPGPAGESWRLVRLEDVTAEREAALRAEREVQRLRATLHVQREVTAVAADRDAALRVVAERAVGLFPAADGAVVELRDGDELRYAAAAGALADTVGTRVTVAGSLSGTVLTTGAPAHCRDSATDPRVDRATCERLGIAAMLIAPLLAGDEVIGALKISSPRPNVFDDTDEQQLALLADSLSSALRHADSAARNATLLAERTVALAALEASETRFRLAFHNSPVGLTLAAVDAGGVGRYLHANPTMTAITGYRTDELTSMTFRQLQHPDDVAASTELFRTILTGERDAVQAVRRYLHKDGHVVWVSLRVAAVRADDGTARYLVVQVEDVTAQRAAQAQLEQQARLLRLIPAAVIVRSLDGTIRWWNTGAETLYGWALPCAVGRMTHRLLGTVFPAGGSVQDQYDSLVLEGRWQGQLQHITADGRTVTVLSRQVMHSDPDVGSGTSGSVLEVNTDVTAARAAERALAESEQQFRAQFSQSAAGQVVRALDGSLVDVNPAYAAMLGHTVEELVGVGESDLLHPDDLPANHHEIAALFAGDADSYTHQSRLRHADGHWVDVEATVSVVREASGRPKHFIGVFTDISARRAAEAARDEAAAALAERNTELERANQLKLDLIGMLGHEIGNPLAAIMGYSEVLADNWADLDDVRRGRAVTGIARQAHRLDDIVREVLAMVSIDASSISARREPRPARAEIGTALAAMDCEPIPVLGDDHSVLVNPEHLQQILTNLLSNAAKYGGGATAIRIEPTDGRVRIRVEDRGPGVPDEFKPRLFERLARADRDARNVKGTGLGLYIVRNLTRANHGEVHHEPNPAGGSVFVLDLEAAPRKC
jgi:PAS domain S-box-containing protein